MSLATQTLPKDDGQKPAFLWLQGGRQRFEADCLRCHSVTSPRGVATRYLAWDEALRKPLTLSARINQCRVRHLQAAPLAPESEALLGLETFVAHQSRGLPITPAAGEPMHAVRARPAGLALAPGPLDLPCVQCHGQRPGRRLGGSALPQVHATAYPIYRLEWQGMGSLQRRLRDCLSRVRAEPYACACDEFTALEAYLMQRAAGMTLETFGVRP